MALNAWTRELGTEQGRIAPQGWEPPAGAFAFVLGFDEPGHFEELDLNDYAEVSQSATFAAGAVVVRLTARFRPPTSSPAGTKWRFSVRIDGTEYAHHDLVPGRTRDRVTLAANVSKLAPGAHTLAFRLQLVVA